MPAGEVVKVDGVRHDILSVDTKKQLGNEFVNETADGTFRILRIKATNDRKESSTLTDSAIKLEANGKTYDADLEGTTTFLLSSGSGGQSDEPFFLRDINPDTTTTGYVVFDVPPKVARSSDAQVRFNELGFGETHGYIALR